MQGDADPGQTLKYDCDGVSAPPGASYACRTPSSTSSTPAAPSSCDGSCWSHSSWLCTQCTPASRPL